MELIQHNGVVGAPRIRNRPPKNFACTREAREIRHDLMDALARHISRIGTNKACALIGGNLSTTRGDIAAIKRRDVETAGTPRFERLVYIYERLGLSARDAIVGRAA